MPAATVDPKHEFVPFIRVLCSGSRSGWKLLGWLKRLVE